MADQPKKRGRPRKPESEKKAPSVYHLFTEQKDGSLKPLGTFKGRRPDEIVTVFLDGGGKANGEPFVIVPDRNLSKVRAEVETTTKVKLSAA